MWLSRSNLKCETLSSHNFAVHILINIFINKCLHYSNIFLFQTVPSIAMFRLIILTLVPVLLVKLVASGHSSPSNPRGPNSRIVKNLTKIESSVSRLIRTQDLEEASSSRNAVSTKNGRQRLNILNWKSNSVKTNNHWTKQF